MKKSSYHVGFTSQENELTANTETPKPVSFNPDNLETLGAFQYEDDLGGQITIVHPHYDKDGTVYSYVTNFGYKSKYHVYSLAPGSASRKLIATIPVQEPAYMHSIGMTENYIILTEFPLVVNPLQFDHLRTAPVTDVAGSCIAFISNLVKKKWNVISFQIPALNCLGLITHW